MVRLNTNPMSEDQGRQAARELAELFGRWATAWKLEPEDAAVFVVALLGGLKEVAEERGS